MRVLRVGVQRVLLVTSMLLAGIGARPAAAVTIDVGSASANPGDTVEIVVALSAGTGEPVAATQNDIAFDESVLSLVWCRINRDIGPGSAAGKSLHKAASAGMIRNMVLSTESSAPIPGGSVILYSCTFRVAADAPAGPTYLSNTEMVASDSHGGRYTVSGASGTVMVGGAAGARGSGGGRPAAPEPMRPLTAEQPAAVQPGAAPPRAEALGVAPAAPAAAPPAPVREGGEMIGEPPAAPAGEETPTAAAATAAATRTRPRATASSGTATPRRSPTAATPPATAGTPVATAARATPTVKPR